MTDYLIDDNLDIILPLTKITDISDLLFQQVVLLLNTWTSDFVYDITMGIDYEGKIINSRDIDVTEIEIEYYSKVSKLQNFKKIENFGIKVTEVREIIITFDVYSIENKFQTFEQVA
jgi:aminopeptidase C